VSPEEVELARKRLAIETKLKRIDQRLARQKFEAQSNRDTSSGWKAFFTPTGGTLVVAIFGLLGIFYGKWEDYNINRRTQETTVILKASEVPQSFSAQEQDVQRAKNLLWFARAGYVTLPESFVVQLEKASGLNKDELPSAPVFKYSGEGSLSSSSLLPAPPKGLVLIVEWWYPPNPTPCGIWIATTAVPFSQGVEGRWWYVPPERVSQHIDEYKSKPNSVNCEVKDFRRRR
jgi:hypothetical protein